MAKKRAADVRSVFQIRGVLFVIFENVVGKPVAEEPHKLDSHVRGSGPICVLEFEHSGGQGVVLFFVCGVIRITGLAQGSFFGAEMTAGVADQSVERLTDLVATLALRHGLVELVD